jgi:Icc-related predicted phosphoesterase
MRVYFATDLHGSEKCFRKFLNGATAYRADVLVLGGDLAGKAILPIVRNGAGFRARFQGRGYEFGADDDQLDEFQRMVANCGFYPWIADTEEIEHRQRDGSLAEVLLELMTERLRAWTVLANERLRPPGLRLFWMLGNDDPPELEALLRAAPWGEYAEGEVLDLDADHELASFGYANITPWHTFRELPEAELSDRLSALCGNLRSPERAVLNLHVPPFDSGLDSAPRLDAELTVQQRAGQPILEPVGSTAVRATLENFQPLVSLHGHVHECSGFKRIGRTLAINPGSDYGMGMLNGALVTLGGEDIQAFQLLRG